MFITNAQTITIYVGIEPEMNHGIPHMKYTMKL